MSSRTFGRLSSAAFRATKCNDNLQTPRSKRYKHRIKKTSKDRKCKQKWKNVDLLEEKVQNQDAAKVAACFWAACPQQVYSKQIKHHNTMTVTAFKSNASPAFGELVRPLVVRLLPISLLPFLPRRGSWTGPHSCNGARFQGMMSRMNLNNLNNLIT